MSHRSHVAFICFLLALLIVVMIIGATRAHAAPGMQVCDGLTPPNCSPFIASNITDTATHVLKTGAGWFHSICINKPVATSVITIYDNSAASGTIIATITLPATLLEEGVHCADFDAAFATGLTVKTATAASDITVMYR